MPKKGSKAQSRTLSLSQGKAENSVCSVCVAKRLTKQDQAPQTMVADTYVSRAAQKAGHTKKGGNGTGATSHSGWREPSEATVPLTSSQSLWVGFRRPGGMK